MGTKQITAWTVYEGRRGNRRIVVEIYDGFVSFTERDRHNPHDAPDAAITLRAFARWAQREISP